MILSNQKVAFVYTSSSQNQNASPMASSHQNGSISDNKLVSVVRILILCLDVTRVMQIFRKRLIYGMKIISRFLTNACTLICDAHEILMV